jgi:hypothetical protein
VEKLGRHSLPETAADPKASAKKLKTATVKRSFSPRPPIAVAPLAISTENCLLIGGIVSRKLRELLAQHPDVPRSRAGHTIIVEASHFYALLERVRVPERESEQREARDDENDDQPTSVDDVLARLGKERIS